MLHSHICKYCHSEFFNTRNNRSKYCSKKCADLGLRKQLDRQCPICNNIFRVDHANAKQIFCSHKCSAIHDKQIASVNLICKLCKQEFQRPKWESDQIYCSQDCASKARKGRRSNKKGCKDTGKWIKLTCIQCGKEFEQVASQVIHRGIRKFCSRRCMGDFMSIDKLGVNNPQYKDGKGKERDRGPNWQMQRKLALKRDGSKCAICGEKRIIGKHNVGVHHIIPYREFNGDYVSANQLTNLITLCRKHHSKVEFGRISCPVPLF